MSAPVGGAEVLSVGADRAQELFFERGWTDGLPIVPPTPERVAALLATTLHEPGDVVAVVPTRQRAVTAEIVAVNAVMAGCLPVHFPIVLAAFHALMDPVFNAPAAFASTGGAAVCTIVSGPYGEEAGVNAGASALGSGARANAAIGRSLRLIAQNVFDARPGERDATSIGSPARYTLCVGEAPPPPGWSTLREHLGYAADETTVTLMATESPRQVANHLNGTAEGVLASYASALASPTTYIAGRGGQVLFVVGPEHALALAEGGCGRAEAAEAVATRSRIHPDDLGRAGIRVPERSAHAMRPGPDGLLPMVASADDVLLVTAGGAGAGWSACLPSWAPAVTSRAVTRKVHLPDEELPSCGPDGCALPARPEGAAR